jgi:hypothetical protein
MKTRPQTIQIFLPDGSPTSIKEAEITNRLVKAVFFPRNKINEVSKRELVNYTGVYFLFGIEEETGKNKVYIGEGEDCFKRIQSHNRNKDFWTHCVIVTTKTNEYTKTDAKFLEHYCLDKAQEVGRYKTENDTGSKKPSLSESREYDLLDNFETLKILLATLGYPMFESTRKASSNKDVFYCKGKKALATGEMIDDGFVVYKGSKANISETQGIGATPKKMRLSLKEKGIFKEVDGSYVFQEDYVFNSPSAAAASVMGRNSNGWKSWVNQDGQTLDEVKRS